MGRKHCGKKEKLLVTSNFSFSHSVFKRLVLQTRKNQGLFGKGLTWDIVSLRMTSTPWHGDILRSRDDQAWSKDLMTHSDLDHAKLKHVTR